jgi:hypothetical protein
MSEVTGIEAFEYQQWYSVALRLSLLLSECLWVWELVQAAPMLPQQVVQFQEVRVAGVTVLGVPAVSAS